MKTVRKLEEVVLGPTRKIASIKVLSILGEFEDGYIAYYEESILGQRVIIPKTLVYKEGEKLTHNSNVYYVLHEITEDNTRLRELRSIISYNANYLHSLKLQRDSINEAIMETEKTLKTYESLLKRLGGCTNGCYQTYSEKTT